MRRAITFVSALGAVIAAAATPAWADVAGFYKGKQFVIVVGYATGGGYDAYARLVSRHIGDHIPGKPNVIVQNMPGAGSLRAANYLYSAAPKDGTVIGTFSRNMPLMGVLGGNKNVQFDPRKFVWLGSPSSAENDAYMLFVRKDAPAKSFADLIRPGGPEVIVGGTASGATGNDIAVLMRDTTGARIKLIAGYRDTNALNPAIERGEIQGRFVGLSSVSSTYPHWLRPDSPVRVLLQFARKTRHPAFKDAPTARELVKDKKDRTLVTLAEIPYQLSRPFVAPPDIPADRAKALQDGFMAMCKSQKFLADSQKMGVDVSPVGAKDAGEMLAEIATAPEEAKTYLRNLLFAPKKKKAKKS
ncbi:MAG: Bug family tripartite tricarboxylate transporter substrate binding protein [Beijerinckiaceae bacterium]